MATPNYGYEKRQRELEKKRKKEDKARAKADRKAGLVPDGEGQGPEEADGAAHGGDAADAGSAGEGGDGGGDGGAGVGRRLGPSLTL